MNTLQAQVYVGDLPSSIDDSFIKTLFQECGTILNVVLKKHKSGNGAFAFVTFDTRESAAQAINEINYTKLDGVPIRISWSDPETRKIRASGKGNLFIRGLDESIEVSQLHEAFSNFGDIISCKIPLTNGKSRGYAYIQFRNPEDAERARTDLADACINGKPITIEQYVRQPKKQPAETFTNVYVKNLPASIDTVEKLRAIFEQFGEVQSPNLPLGEDGKPKGFAFCNFCKHEDAVKAVEGLNDTTINGMEEGVKLVAARAMPKKERVEFMAQQLKKFRAMKNAETKGRNLFVKNFDEQLTDEELKNFFSQFGEIESAVIAREADKVTSKKFGFVLFKTVEGAQKAIEMTPVTPINGQQLYVAVFIPREERQRLLLQQRSAREAANANNMPMGMPMGMQMGMPMGMQQMPMNMQQMPMNMQIGMPMGMPQMQAQFNITNIQKLRSELQDRNVDLKGQQAKQILGTISEEQAGVLINNQEKLEQWIQQF